jgi:HSP20 family protein
MDPSTRDEISVEHRKEAPAQSATPASNPGSDLMRRLWAGLPGMVDPWPFGELARDLTDLGTGGIRVEEKVEDGFIVIRAELPGIDPEKDVHVTVEDGMLSIRAERREEKRHREPDEIRSEFRYGTFVRRIQLPRGASADVVAATYRDGILEVRLPAPAPGSASRRIPVERG